MQRSDEPGGSLNVMDGCSSPFSSGGRYQSGRFIVIIIVVVVGLRFLLAIRRFQDVVLKS